jgi:H+-transporting ATPase
LKCTKGAPQIVLALCNNPSIEEEVAGMVQELAAGGYRTIGVAKTGADGKWQMLGLIPLYDPPRDDTKETIAKARQMMVSVKMITGDQLAIAKETAKLLNLGDKIYNSEMMSEKSSPLEKELLDQVLLEADGFAEVFPEHKFAIVKMIQDKGKRCGMTGDGVNDAPALKKADVGIAVEGATDAARAAADIVLASPGLAVIIEAIYRARKTFQRIKNYMIYRIATTLQILFFFFVTMVAMDPSKYPCTHHDHCDRPNTFTLPVTGLVLITIFNDGTIISIAYDKVKVSREPEKWNLTIVFIMSSMLGFLSFISAIVFLILGLQHMQSGSPNKVLHAFGLHTWGYSELMTLVWYKVAMQGFFNVFSARTDGLFFTRMPGKLMLSAVSCAMIICTILTPYWVLNVSTGTGTGGGKMPKMHGATWGATVFVLIYSFVCFLVFDIAKVGLYRLIKFYYDMKAPEKQLYTGQFLTDTFLVFTTGYDRQHRKSIITRRSIAAVEESQAYKPAKPGQ